MKNWQTLALSTLVATSLAACSSDDNDGDNGGTDPVIVDDGIADVPDDTTTGAGPLDPLPGTGDEPGDANPLEDGTGGTSEPETPEPEDPATETPEPETPEPPVTEAPGPSEPFAGNGQGLPQADVVPILSNADPFGYAFETDVLAPAGDGIPTQPQNLRIDLVSSDFAEFNWSPSADDGAVAAYLIERSDGQTYTITPSLEDGLALDEGTYVEYAKYWNTTSFIDCNATRFAFEPGSAKDADGPWNCADARPQPGTTYSYTVTAIDDEGNASAPSDPLEIAYLSDDPADRSGTVDFIDDFDVVWSDEFDGTELNGANWQSSLRGGPETFINGEQQYFVNTLQTPAVAYDPFSFANGALTITAVPTTPEQRAQLPDGCNEADPILQNMEGRERCEFLSGALSSHDRMQFVYGYVEGRIKASNMAGALSSFYLLNRYPGENNPEAGSYQYHAPEIDILEYLGENPFGDEDAFQTYHFGDVNYFVERSSPTLNHENEDGSLYGDDFHTFGVLWEPQLVIWYIDGVEIRRLTGPQISRQPMNIVNYLVAGSGWAPEPDANDPTPIQMEVDYIRVYQRDEFKGTLSVGRP